VSGRAILVTGAGGFIGSEVVRSLAAEPGLRVRAGTRDGRAFAGEVEACRLDVCDPASLRAALAGIDGVVHCAVGGRRTTVEGTSLLLGAARAAGVRRVVHLSSIAVYGAAPGRVAESTPVLPAAGRGYAHWKAAAEAQCRQETGVDVIVLRPAIVYGPGSQQWIVRPARRLLSGAWGALGRLGSGTCNPVHVRDVAAACLAALRAPADAAGEAFNISGPETLDWDAWHARLAAALGCPPPPRLSVWTWRRRALVGLPCRALARLVPPAGRHLDRWILAGLAPSERALFALAASYPTDKAAARLGWRPRIGLAEGLAEAAAWLAATGLARRA
jgi:nucleoside-diphosphate-sugar epimerase